MLSKILPILICVSLSAFSFIYAGDGDATTSTYGAIIMFPSAPNPTTDKCLIRTYLPDSDPNSSIRILDKDSTPDKRNSHCRPNWYHAAPPRLNVSDWKEGTYLYQLFYKGEARFTRSFVVKH